MKSTLAAVKRQRFPARASRQVLGLFILGLGYYINKNNFTLSRSLSLFLFCRKMSKMNRDQ